MDRRKLNRGDPVWYRPRRFEDYGFEGQIPAVFLGAFTSGITLRLLLKDGTQKNVRVLSRRVRPRVVEREPCGVCGWRGLEEYNAHPDRQQQAGRVEDREQMPITFIVAEHLERPDRQVVEVWIDGTFVATLAGQENGKGLRLISKYPLQASLPGTPERSIRIGGNPVNVIELAIFKGLG